MSKKRLVTDTLFIVQILSAFILAGSQFFRMLSTIEGVNFAMFATMEVFLGINLYLAIMAHRVQPSRVTRQTVATYAIWTVLIASNIVAILWHGGYKWGKTDVITFALTGLGVVATLFVARRCRLGVTDPVVKGYLAVFFKATPQLLLAAKILLEGNAGTPVVAICAGHVTILVRLGQLWFSIREAGWDRNRIGSAISEVANELSWVVVTIAWILKELS